MQMLGLAENQILPLRSVSWGGGVGGCGKTSEKYQTLPVLSCILKC